MVINSESKIIKPEFKVKGLIGNNYQSQRSKPAYKLFVIFIFFIIFFSTTIWIIIATTPPIEYYREYPKGYSTNDNSPDNIITVRPHINNTPSWIRLTYHIQNHTLIIESNNIASIWLDWEKGIESENGNIAYFTSLITDPLYIQVKGSDGTKNLTIINLPKTPSKIYKDGEEIDFTINNDELTIISNPNGNYTIIFDENLDVDGGGVVGGEDGIFALIYFGVPCWAWMVVPLVIIIFFWIFSKKWR